MSELMRRQRLTAYGVLVREGSVLLVRASPHSDVPGTWWLPGGGVGFGESPADCVVREFHEETGLFVDECRLRAVVTDVVALPARAESVHTVRTLYDVSASSGVVRTETDGSTDAVQWLTIARAGELKLVPFVREVVAELQAAL